MNREEIRLNLTGPVMSVFTPFTRDGEVDYDGVRRVIDASLAGGSNTVVLTVGDSHYDCLCEEEIAEVTRVTCEHTAGRAMVIAADRYHSTDRAIAFAKFAKETGADIVMCLPPDWGNSCTPESLAEHYAAVAGVMPVMIVTNRFISRGDVFGLETINRALDISEDIVAIKDDMGGSFAQELCILAHERCAIISGGQKQNHMSMWPYGCDGYLSTFVVFNPDVSRSYWRAIQGRDIPAAAEIIAEQDMPFFKFISSLAGGPDAGIHGMVELYGIASRYRRRPYVTITDSEMEKLKETLKGLRLL